MKGYHKKLLIIAYAFPPHSVVGSMRPLRMAKYLEKITGWCPVILTVERDFRRNDYSLLDEIPANITVYRTGTIEPAFWFERMRQTVYATGSDAEKKDLHPALKLLGKTFSVLSEAASIPDPQVLWNLPVIEKGRRIVREEGISALLVTSPPWSLQISGFMLKKITGVPWMVDYRDPWTDIKRKDRPSFINEAEQWLEKHLLEQADMVLSTSDTYSKDLIRKFPNMNHDKFQTLHNGFDEEKFNGLPEKVGNNKFTIVHLGTMYSMFNPYVFLGALKKWMALSPEVEKRLELLFVGNINDQTQRAINESGLQHISKVTGFVPHQEAISLCAKADMLLLSMGTEDNLPRGWLPSKLFEYLALNRPILAYTAEGEASAMVRSINKGHVVTTSDLSSIFAFMDELYEQKWQSRNQYIPWENESGPMQSIQQEYLMKRLGSLLDSIAVL